MKPRVTLAALVVVTSCAAGPKVELLVSAAASLTDAFAEIESDFEREHPDIDVVLNLAATSTLRQQILEGAPADVFASADTANMDQLAGAGMLADEAAVFASNRLQIAVSKGNPADIDGLSDFAEPDLLIGLCAPSVPCGRLARLALESASVSPSVDSEEPNVRALLTKIASGELDAGIVYRSDVLAESDVEGITVPSPHNQVNRYLIATLTGAPHSEAATEFVAYVLSAEAQEILSRHGLGRP